MTTIALVPARGGSRGIPKKNIRSFCGRPLIHWTLSALAEAKGIDQIVLATDCNEIAATARELSLPQLRIYNRKPGNATDGASTESLILEFLSTESALHLVDDDLLVLAQVTSPFTRSQDLDGALDHLHQSGADSLLSCVRFKRFLWRDDGTPINYDYVERPRRQDFAGTLLENGAFYINRVGLVRTQRNRLSGKIACYEMPAWSALELDDADDWVAAEAIFARHANELEPST